MLLVSVTGCQLSSTLPDLGAVEDFSFIERSGKQVTKADLRGKVWVASFLFTRCTGPCPTVSVTMTHLQDELRREHDVRLVTFTLDPDHDDPQELTRYAEGKQADPRRWLFLTGKEEEIHRLVRESFKIGVERNKDKDATPGTAINHDPRLVLVDRSGHIRGYFAGLADSRSDDPDGEFRANLKLLRESIAAVAGPDFPAINAGLNTLSGILLLLGYLAIRKKLVGAHEICMLLALAVSAIFLSSYLYYHIALKYGKETTLAEQWPSAAPQWLRWTYYGILISHVFLAIVVTPMALRTAYLGLKGRLQGHVSLARWTLPLWLYVSITGVVVYWMLYRLYAIA